MKASGIRIRLGILARYLSLRSATAALFLLLAVGASAATFSSAFDFGSVGSLIGNRFAAAKLQLPPELSPLQVTGLPPPVLGNYPNRSVQLSGNTTVTPDAIPTDTTRINVATSTGFHGRLEGNPANGVVRITDAHPAGTYPVTVTGFNAAGVATSRTFTLTVTTPSAICGPVNFTDAASISVGTGPLTVAVGDFNGDGVQDLAVVNSDSNNVSILLGNGTGGFGPATNVGVGSRPTSVAVGDFNGDGKEDLVVTNQNDFDVSILIGDGVGNFVEADNFSVGNAPQSVAVGDFNGDGYQDIVTANRGSNDASVLFGDGTGGFGQTATFAVGTAPVSVAIGSFNDDNIQDLVVVNENSNNVSVFFGDSKSGFSNPLNFAAGISPISIVIGDFNNDGNQDLAISNKDTDGISILLGDGLKGFSAPANFGVGIAPRAVGLGDFNGDGNQDLAAANVASGNVSVLLGNGEGGFSDPIDFAAGSSPHGLVVGDFNGDGNQDLATANTGSSNLSILLRYCLPTFSINDVTHNEGNGGTTSYTFTVTKTGSTALTTSVSYETTNGTAVAPSDYTAIPVTTLNFGPADTTMQVTVLVNGDATFEANETFTVHLSNALGATISDADGTGTITNDDAQPSFSIDNVTHNEGDAGTTSYTFTVTKTGSTALSSSVSYETTNGTAVAPSDYTAIPVTTLNFGPADTTMQVTVLVNGDATFEANETFTVHLSNALGATISDADGTGTITNDDAQPSFSIDNVAHNEGDAGTTSYTFTVTKTGSTALSSSVSYETTNGTAVAPSDYTAIPITTLNFGPADTTMQVTVLVNGDTTLESNETFTVHLSNALGATISDADGTGTITNDDAPPSFSIDNVTHDEGDAGTTSYTFTVTKTGSTALSSSVSYETTNGTAVAPSDYTAIPITTLNFGPADTAMQVTVLVNGDATLEPNEVFMVHLSNALGATISDSDGTGTITNDDGPPSFSIDNVTHNEGDAGATSYTFTVTKTGNTALSSSVSYETTNGTAVAPSDYTAIPITTLNFGPADTTMQVTVLVNGDTTFEANETFTVHLSNALGATISDADGAGTITNDDGPPSFSIDNVTHDEGDAGTTSYTFTVTKTGSTALSSSVSYETTNGTAVAPGDYTAIPITTLNFGPADTTMQVTVLVNGDTTFEANETFTVHLSNALGATISDADGTGTITNDDGPPSFSIDNVTHDEGDAGTTSYTFTVTKTGSTALSSSVSYETTNGTAVAPSDYTAIPITTLNFGPADTTMQVTVLVNGDTAFEANETFTVHLSNALGATISDADGTGTITNDDTQPSFSIDNVTHNEGDAGTTSYTFTVTKTGSTALTSSVSYETTNGTAVAPSDYTAIPITTLNFGPADTAMQVTVLVNGDATFEANEAFTVQLSNALGATISDADGTGTIANDDAQPSFSIDNMTHNEGDAGTTSYTFTVTKTGSTALTSSVSYETTNGTAVAPSDYTAIPITTLNFGPADTTMQVTVLVNGDATLEPDEVFMVHLSNESGATISDADGTGTITNDDAQPTFSIGDVTHNEGDANTTSYTFTVTKTGSTELSSSVDYETTDGTAVAPGDYTALPVTTLNFGPADTTMQVTVLVNGDATFEADETFTVHLSNALGATISDTNGTGTITNDDAPPSFSIDNVTHNEGDAGTTSFTFTVTKTGSTALSSSVDSETVDGTAVAPGDYTAIPVTTLNFLPADTAKTIMVFVNGDTTVEPDETFTVHLTNAINATFSNAVGTGTILNEDVPPTPTPTPTPARAVNLSTRTRVETGDGVTIAGFIITGNAPKQVLLRAIGPSLSGSGIVNPLADPVMELHGPCGFGAINNNDWRDTQEAAIQATGIPPSSNLESAILVTLNPGSYTAVVKGHGTPPGTGIALVEVYDLDQFSDSKLANISTRAFVSTGNDIVIAGFMLAGNKTGNDQVVIRGIGPSLAAAGTSNTLADPTLELRDSEGALMAANNDWQDNPAQAAELSAVGLAPGNNREAGIAATLPPGPYTALLAGVENSTGVGMVELYNRGDGSKTVPLPTCSPTPGLCVENFDGVPAPALPAGWVATNAVSAPPLWVNSATTSDSAPNNAVVKALPEITDKRLDSRDILINSDSPLMSFRNNFNLQQNFDGAVLEVSAPNISEGAFTDITNEAVGGSFVVGGYTGTIGTALGNPIAGRMAWSGNSAGYINSVANLGPNLNGQTIKLRFRLGTDQTIEVGGWRIDTISIVGGTCP